MSGLVILLVVLAIAAAGTLGAMLWLHRRENRRRWMRYQPLASEGEPRSIVCPHCRRRWYSARVIRDRTCPGCGQAF